MSKQCACSVATASHPTPQVISLGFHGTLVSQLQAQAPNQSCPEPVPRVAATRIVGVLVIDGKASNEPPKPKRIGVAVLGTDSTVHHFQLRKLLKFRHACDPPS